MSHSKGHLSGAERALLQEVVQAYSGPEHLQERVASLVRQIDDPATRQLLVEAVSRYSGPRQTEMRALLRKLTATHAAAIHRSPVVSQVPSLFPEIPKESRQTLQRILYRVGMIGDGFSQFRRHPQMMELVAPIIGKAKSLFPDNQFFFGQDHDYLVWWFEDSLEDIVMLFHLGETNMAREYLATLDSVSRYLQGMGPMMGYIFNQIETPRVLGESNRPFLYMVHATESAVNGTLGQFELALDKETVRFSSGEVAAWARVKEALLGIRGALSVEGKARGAMFKDAAIDFAGEAGLVNMPLVTMNDTTIPFSLLRNLQLEILVSEFLLAHAKKFSLPESEIRFLRESELPGLLEDLNDQLPETLNMKRGSDFLPESGEPAAKPMELNPPPLVPDPLVAESEWKGRELIFIQIGSRAWNGPQQDLIEILGNDRDIPAGPALLIGPGDGAEAFYLADPTREGHYPQVDAIDVSAVAVHRMQKMVRRYPALAHIHPLLGNAADFEFKKGHYARIIAMNLFGFLPPKKQASFMKRVAHALLPGGKATITIDLASGSAFKAHKEEAIGVHGNTITLARGSMGTVTKHFLTLGTVQGVLQEAGLIAEESDWKVHTSRAERADYKYARVEIFRNPGILKAGRLVGRMARL